jgi:excisionase family DNA binding protein
MGKLPEFLTLRELADEVRVSPETARSWCHGGLLPYVMLGGRIKVRRRDLEEFIAQRLPDYEPAEAKP